jgi:hypothetical protein
MFYTGLDPYTEKPVFVPKTKEEKAEQRALLQYFRPENRQIVINALRRAGRTDLIGYGENCLIRPDTQKNLNNTQNKNKLNNTQSKKQTPSLSKRASVSHPKQTKNLKAQPPRKNKT